MGNPRASGGQRAPLGASMNRRGTVLLRTRSPVRLASLATILLGTLLASPAIFAAPEAARTIAFYNIHTKETLSVVYKKSGKYVPEAMKQINWMMRDWRKDIVIEMDPALIDLLWEVHTELGSHEPIHLICGHRSEATNEMLRKTVGGQAKQSQHIGGKAADVTFPDVPLKHLRYSGLIRERGGVGYYPTSAIPFVHLDTARVRHWPRMPRDELALLFPSGHTQHDPASGGPITKDDVRAARQRNKELATQVASFLEYRLQPKTPTLVADNRGVAPATPAEQKVALAEPRESAPQLVAAPRMVDRPSRLVAGPSQADRSKLDQLVAFAAIPPRPEPPPPQLVAPPTLVARAPHPSQPSPLAATATKDSAPKAAAPAEPSARVAALAPRPAAPTQKASPSPLAAPPSDELPERPTPAEIETAWVHAPEFDEDHPEELSYRPFPLAPLLTATASPDDPALAQLTHPDVAKAIELIDDEGTILPMRMRPGIQMAQLMWAQEFRGGAVDAEALEATVGMPPAPSGLNERSVKTLSR